MPLVGDIDLTIRQAQRDDGPALAQLMCELGYPTAPGEMDARLELIVSNTAYRTLVAIVNGSVCGMIGTIVYPSYEHNDPGARILALVTLSAQRRRGSVGRSLPLPRKIWFSSAVDAIADARTDNESPEVFHPGDGRSFYGGVSWNW